MTNIVIWFFGIWTALFVGVALSLVGFDAWLNHRREALRKLKGEVQ